MKITESMQAAIGGVIAGVTNRTEAMAMVQEPLQEMVTIICVAEPPSVELATALHNRYGVDFNFSAGKLVGVTMN